VIWKTRSFTKGELTHIGNKPTYPYVIVGSWFNGLRAGQQIKRGPAMALGWRAAERILSTVNEIV
jgi:hypothetical protein